MTDAPRISVTVGVLLSCHTNRFIFCCDKFVEDIFEPPDFYQPGEPVVSNFSFVEPMKSIAKAPTDAAARYNSQDLGVSVNFLIRPMKSFSGFRHSEDWCGKLSCHCDTVLSGT